MTSKLRGTVRTWAILSSMLDPGPATVSGAFRLRRFPDPPPGFRDPEGFQLPGDQLRLLAEQAARDRPVRKRGSLPMPRTLKAKLARAVKHGMVEPILAAMIGLAMILKLRATASHGGNSLVGSGQPRGYQREHRIT